jgi:hypothetical protein
LNDNGYNYAYCTRYKAIIRYDPYEFAKLLAGNGLHTLRDVLHAQKEQTNTADYRKNHLQNKLAVHSAFFKELAVKVLPEFGWKYNGRGRFVKVKKVAKRQKN